ncbi:MAG: hypothetical protein ACYCW6_07425 [Candidatus Xenobia bacterium]
MLPALLMTGRMQLLSAAREMTYSTDKPKIGRNGGQTLYILIGPSLTKAGWNLGDHTLALGELSVDGGDAIPRNGIADCFLYNPSGAVIAVVELPVVSRFWSSTTSTGAHPAPAAVQPSHLGQTRLRRAFSEGM